ncbi:MAG: T9SS type A sorting domain-containing protein [Ignavibacteria bacterium]
MNKTFIYPVFLISLFFINSNIVNAQWVQAHGPYNNPTCPLAIKGENVYAVDPVEGLILSTDNGATWTSIGKIFPRPGVSVSLTIKDSNFFAGTTSGIRLSTDNGVNWNMSNNGLPVSTYVGTIIISPDSAGNLFAGTLNGVFLSTNNGADWTARNSGLGDTIVNSLLFKGTNLFAGTNGGVFVSADNGMSWDSANTGITDVSVISLASDGSNLYAGTTSGVFRSTDNGENWISIGLSDKAVKAFAFKDSVLYAGSSEGFFLTTNNGTSWIDGKLPTNVYSIVIKDNNIFVSASAGIFLSTNNGAGWSSLTGRPYGMQVDFARSDSSLFAGTNAGVFLSKDNGMTWMPAGLPNSSVYSLTIKDSNLFALTGENLLFVTTNNGINWSSIISPIKIPYSMIFNGENLYILSYDSIFSSSNNGASWTFVSTGIPNEYITNMIPHPDSTNVFYAWTTYHGVFKSADNCTTWTSVNSGLTDTLITTLIFSGSNLFAGTTDGVFLTTNNGESWNPVNTGIRHTYVCAFAADPSLPGKVFAGGYSKHLFLTTNNGSVWNNINHGFPDYDIYALAICGENLAAGTNGSNIWYRPLSEIITDVDIPGTGTPRDYCLYQNYPNPFNPTTNITYYLPMGSFVSLKLYDVLGRELKTLIKEYQNSGNHSARFDGSKLPSGVYIYRLEAGSFKDTRKLLLLK